MQISPLNLLVPEKMDIIIKYLYVKSVVQNEDVDFYRDLYRRHINYRTGGREETKATADDYLESFNNMIASMQSAGFDKNHPIPISIDNDLISAGSHRLACALYFNIQPYVEFVEGQKGVAWDYRWFENHFSKSELDLILRTYIQLKPQNVVAVILWGAVKKHWDDIQRHISGLHKIVASRDFYFDKRSLVSLVYDIYAFEEGVKTPPAVMRKIPLLQKYKPEIRLILADIEDPEYISTQGRSVCKQALALKQNVRDSMNAVLPSHLQNSYVTIHTSDNPKHLAHITNILLNENNLIALRKRRHYEYRGRFLDLLEEYCGVVTAHGIDMDNCCIVGSAPLEVFGMKNCTDIDFIMESSKREGRFPPSPTVHLANKIDLVIQGYHRNDDPEKLLSDDEIIHDMNKHFYFRGLKFANLQIIRDRKSKERRTKDIRDIKLIDILLATSSRDAVRLYSKDSLFRRMRLTIGSEVHRWFILHRPPWLNLNYFVGTIVKYIPPSIRRQKISHRLFGTYLAYRNNGLKRTLLYERDSFRLKKLKDIHKGQRCFIIGTGPSINKTNLSLLKNEITFGVNRLYDALTESGIRCNYYAVCDEGTWKKYFQDILGLDTTLFLSGYPSRDYLSNLRFYRKFQKNRPFTVRGLGRITDTSTFSRDLSWGEYWGGNVMTDICLQAAYHMGFQEVYLLGCDHDDSGIHFNDLTNPVTVQVDSRKMFELYEVCKKVYETDGRKIINATVGGKLEVFQRQKLEDIIGEDI